MGAVLPVSGSHRFDNFHCLDADAGDAHQEIDHLFLVIGEAIGVEFLADGGVFRSLFLVLVEDPLDGGAGAECCALFSGV